MLTIFHDTLSRIVFLNDNNNNKKMSLIDYLQKAKFILNNFNLDFFSY